MELLHFNHVKSAHVGEIRELLNKTFGWTLDEEEFVSDLRWGQNPVVAIAEKDTHVVGVVTSRKNWYKHYGTEQYLTAVAVHEHHRGKGLARALILTIINAIENKSVRIDTNLENLTAQQLYRSLGFTEIVRSDRVVMRRRGLGYPNIQGLPPDDGLIFNFVNRLTLDSGEVLPSSDERPSLLSLNQIVAKYASQG